MLVIEEKTSAKCEIWLVEAVNEMGTSPTSDSCDDARNRDITSSTNQLSREEMDVKRVGCDDLVTPTPVHQKYLRRPVHLT